MLLGAAFIFAIIIVTTSRASARTSTNEPAFIKVSGFGLIGNREMVRLLRNFQVGGKMPAFIDRTFVEDAALILLSRANGDGYLHATLRGRFKMPDGSKRPFEWTNALDVLLPQDFVAQGGRFELKRGKRFYYDELEFEGLKSIPRRQAERYFVSADVLFRVRRNRVFTPVALKHSLAALKEAYDRAGYQNAVVTTNSVVQNESTGAVDVKVAVREGLPSIVRRVEVKVHGKGDESPKIERTLAPGKPYSYWWQQSLAQTLQSEQYAKGHPDATISFAVISRETNAANIQLDLLADVKAGPLVRLGRVSFRGNKRTKTSVLKRRVKMKEGKPLNRIEAEKSRQRLTRLGVFDAVRLQYEDAGKEERNVVYNFQEAKPISLSVLAGVGSYELLRGGLEFEHRNVFGLAHDFRLRGLQSFKATQGDLFYTMPEVFGENMNLFLQGSGLQREEVSFNREEYGGSVGVQKRLIPIKTDFSLRYNYEFLRALNISSSDPTGVEEARSTSFVIDLTCDRRDHPMLPNRGMKLFSKMEFAAAALGGNVDYQRLIFGASYHIDLNDGRFLHLGVIHGLSFVLGGSDEQLPFNKRFFPGGENSVRGYQDGEASPLDENGDQLGAETFTQGNFEFEQALTRSWSIVTFCDVVGFAQNRADYPWDEVLYSVGGGLRWRTAVGPIRLEYGHNLNPRTHDPSGTLHFSIGFPF